MKHTTKDGHSIYALGYSPSEIAQKHISGLYDEISEDEEKDFSRYKKATDIIIDKINRSQNRMTVIQKNTVEALMYLTTNIDELKYIERNTKMRYRYSNIIAELKNHFGVVNDLEIKAFLHKHQIYNTTTIYTFITIVHWLLLIAIYIFLCSINNISLGIALAGFLPAAILGIFTSILAYCITDTKFPTYRLSARYRSLIKYNARP